MLFTADLPDGVCFDFILSCGDLVSLAFTLVDSDFVWRTGSLFGDFVDLGVVFVGDLVAGVFFDFELLLAVFAVDLTSAVVDEVLLGRDVLLGLALLFDLCGRELLLENLGSDLRTGDWLPGLELLLELTEMEHPADDTRATRARAQRGWDGEKVVGEGACFISFVTG